MRPVLALDLGGTKLAAAIVDGEGRILHKVKRAIDPHAVAAQIDAVSAETVAAAGLQWSDLHGAGLIVPGICYRSTGEVWAPNLFGHDRYPLGRDLRLPARLAMDSDRAGYVLGESWKGVARGLQDVVFLAVGTGIGAGILSGGRLVRGAGDIAGAVGWFCLSEHLQPEYARTGCWETNAAGPSIARRAEGAGGEEVVRAARQGNGMALAVLNETARWLGRGIANIVSLLNPEMVVLGGGLMRAGDLMLETIRGEMLLWAQPVAAREVRLELTALGEDAGLLGAARLAFSDSPQ